MKKNNFYIEEFDNICLLMCFAVVIVYNILLLVIKSNIINIPKEYNNAITILSIVVPYIISIIIFIMKNNTPSHRVSDRIFQHEIPEENDSCFAGIISKNQSDLMQNCILKRERHVNKIYDLIIKGFNDNHRCLIITGGSGAGKSTLLYFLSDKLKQSDIDTEVINGNYNSLVLKNSGRRKVFFLDQFEKAINYTEYIDVIKQSLNNNSYLVFIFPQDFFAQITSTLNFLEPNTNIYTLLIDESDFLVLKEKVKQFCGFEENDFNRYYNNTNNYLTDKKAIILCDILKKVKKNELPLVEFELIGKILENGFDDSILENNMPSFHVLESYLDLWIEKFPYPEIAYSILHLLSDNRVYDINDLKLITFADSHCFDPQGECSIEGLNIIDAINNNLLIDVFSKNGINHFKTKHGYIALQIQKYCTKKEFNPDILKNVDYYRHRIDSEKKQGRLEYFNEIKKRYNRYTDNKSKIPLIVCLFFLGISILVVNMFHLTADNNVHNTYILISIAVAPGIYYIYNYCNRMLRIFSFWKYSITAVLGTLVVICAYLFYEYWGIFMGIEIVILSININFLLRKKTYYIARTKYRNDVIVFFVIGISIILLGILFSEIYETVYDELVFSWNNVYMWLIISYYILFSIYSTLSIVAHINYQYVLIHIGYSNMAIPIAK